MVREVRNTLGSTNLAAPISKPQSLRVEARPVDTAIIGIQDRGIDALVSGLAQFNPALSGFLQQQQFTKDIAEVQQGKQDAALGKEQLSDTELYTHGFLKTKGTNAAAEDIAELQGYMEQNFNPETDDFQGTVKGWLSQKTSANTDKSFLEGYAPIMDRGINSMANRYTSIRQEKLKADVRSTALKNLSLGMKGYVDQGLPIDDVYITSKREEFATHFKMSSTEFDELQFTASKEFGDQGHFEVYEQLKKDRPDGTPGMYFNPEWKTKIDAAEGHAKMQFLSLSKAAETAAKKDREGRQEQALQSVFSGALTGEYGDAVAQFKKLVSEQPNLFLPSEISEWTGKLSSLSKMSQLEETTGQRVNATQLLAHIYSGRAGIKDVMNQSLQGRISYGQTQQLLNDVNSFQTSQRQLAATEAANQYSIYKTTEFKSAEDYLRATLDRTPGPLEKLHGDARTYYNQTKATALLEFTQRAQGLSPTEIPKLTQEILARYTNALNSVISLSDGDNTMAIIPRGPNSGLMRYNTAKELKAAHDSGNISPEEFTFQFNLMKGRREQAQAAKAKREAEQGVPKKLSDSIPQ